MITVVEKFREILNKTKQQQEKINTLSYYPHQNEKINCLGETELASGTALKSREIFRKAVFLDECLESSINVWIIDHNCFHKLAKTSETHISCG